MSLHISVSYLLTRWLTDHIKFPIQTQTCRPEDFTSSTELCREYENKVTWSGITMRCGIDSGMVVVLLITAVLIGLSWVSINCFVVFCRRSPNLNGLPLMRLSWQQKLWITLYTFIVESGVKKKKSVQSYIHFVGNFLRSWFQSQMKDPILWHQDTSALLQCSTTLAQMYF